MLGGCPHRGQGLCRSMDFHEQHMWPAKLWAMGFAVSGHPPPDIHPGAGRWESAGRTHGEMVRPPHPEPAAC